MGGSAYDRGRVFRSIVVGTDGSDTAEEAVRQATDLARSEGASVHLVTAYPDPQLIRERVVGSARATTIDLREVAEALLVRASHRVNAEGIEVDHDAREGDPAGVLIDVARELHADLIVVGDRGRTGVQRFLLGSVPSKLAHHAPCSVMVVRA